MSHDPIIRTVTVSASPARAFEAFTAEVMRWWPGAKHSVSAGAGESPQDIVFEPGIGGAVYEIGHDGRRHEWGEVTEWAPGAGFKMTWHPGKTATEATGLELKFEPAGEGTQVTLIHTGWEIYGDQAAQMRSHYASGWVHVLDDCYAGAN